MCTADMFFEQASRLGAAATITHFCMCHLVLAVPSGLCDAVNVFIGAGEKELPCTAGDPGLWETYRRGRVGSGESML